MAGLIDLYDVDVTREYPYWVAVVRGVRGGATEARRLADLEAEVRDLLAGLLEIDEDSFDLHWSYDGALDRSAVKAVTQTNAARAHLREAQQHYDRVIREAATELRRESVSLRDAAHLLGVSFQRVQQLVNA